MLLHEILPVLSEDAAVSGKADFLNIYKSTLGNVYISLSVDTLPSWVGRCDAFANRQWEKDVNNISHGENYERYLNFTMTQLGWAELVWMNSRKFHITQWKACIGIELAGGHVQLWCHNELRGGVT